MSKRDIKMSVAVTSDTVSESLSELLRRKFATMRKPSAFLAEKYRWGDRKAKGIYQGTLAPTSADLLNMMASDDDVFETVIELTGRKAEWERQRKAIRAILEGKE